MKDKEEKTETNFFFFHFFKEEGKRLKSKCEKLRRKKVSSRKASYLSGIILSLRKSSCQFPVFILAGFVSFGKSS